MNEPKPYPELKEKGTEAFGSLEIQWDNPFYSFSSLCSPVSTKTTT